MELEQFYWIAGILMVPLTGALVWIGFRQTKKARTEALTPPELQKPPTPRSIGFIDRPKLLGQILNPPPQQAGVAGPRIAAICSLHGMGGIGKTELAREAARQLAPNGTAVVNLRGWDSDQPMTEEEALRELCPQIDPVTDSTFTLPQLRAHWRTITAREGLAVILDNLRDESLIDLLRPTAGITLITGRERIVRAGIQLVEVDVMEPEEAAALAIATHPGLSDADAAALAEAVGYLPLAISLAAGYLARSREPVSDLQRRIGQAAGGDTRTGMQALFERVVAYSTRDLSEEQRARWLALSLPPGDFGLWTVEALWQDGDPLPELGDLVRRHLVTPAGEGRWRLHDLLRQYGRTVLVGDPEQEQALWRRLRPSMLNWWDEVADRIETVSLLDAYPKKEIASELPLFRELVKSYATGRIGPVGISEHKMLILSEDILQQLSFLEEINQKYGNTKKAVIEFRQNALREYADGVSLKILGEWAEAIEHFRRARLIAEALEMPQAETIRLALAEAEAHLAGDGSTS